MEKPKFVKAKCQKTGRWYGLSVKQIQGRWKVVDMIDLSDSEAALLASEVKQDSFESNANLIPCSVCGGRRVAGCGCSKKKHQCSKGMKYHFDCLYCNELEIDYRIPTKSEIAGRAPCKPARRRSGIRGSLTGRFFIKPFISSPTICSASAALPPLPQVRSFPPKPSRSKIRPAS